MKRLFLIDGSALVHRSFHAFSKQALLTSRGLDVGMVYGFLLSLLMIIRREKPDFFAITFDTGAPTFRHKMYDQYKANRPPLDEDIREQLPLLNEVIDALRIQRLSMDGWEADDLMGTLADRAESAGLETFLVTGDKDFYQLVTDYVKVYSLPTRAEPNPTIYDREGILEKFGVYPEKVIDMLALMGDSADNVPGVPKVGPKTAISLINEYGDLDTVLEVAPGLKKPLLKKNLVEYADQARLSRQLVIIDKNAPLSAEPDQFTFGPLNNPDARRILAELEFTSILRQLDDLGQQIPSQVEYGDAEKSMQLSIEGAVTGSAELRYEPVTNPEQLRAMIDELRQSEIISLDTETTSINPLRAELVGLSFSIAEKQAWYVAVNYFTNVPGEFTQTLKPKLRPGTDRTTAYILRELADILSSRDIRKTGQNLKYDLHVLKCYDIPVNGVAFDTMIASHLLDSSARQHNLDLLAETQLGIHKIPTSRLIGSGSKQKLMSEVPLDIITQYACEDADVALRLTNLFRQRIETEGFSQLLTDLELPLMNVLIDMEATGVALNLDLLAAMSVEYAEEILKLQDEVFDLAKCSFNLNSTQQLADVLYNKIGLPPGRKTKFGFSTDISELERLAPVHDLPVRLLRYRHLSKLKSTYIDALPQLVHPISGRVHTSYSQTVTSTGRLSSNDPNLQNIPIRTEEGGRIRQAFIAGEPGWKIISADYSQIELRIMAHLSGDELLIQAFKDGMDIHRVTAAWMHDMPPELITPEIRRTAKEVNFGVLYGMGEFGLAQRLGISRKRADEFIQQYFRKMARVKEFIDEVKTQARRDGFVSTMLGRRRPLPDINAKNFRVRQNAERVAVNMPIQGSAADLMKIAMIDVYDMLKKDGFQARMLMQVHDELVFEVPPDEVERLTLRIGEVMEKAMELKVPLEVDVSWGDNWLEAH